MLTEISDLFGMEVYTDKGIALGTVDDLVVETDTKKIYGLYVGNPNPLLVEHSRSVSVPFRWINNVGDIILLKYFPKFVKTEPIPQSAPKAKKIAIDVTHAAHETEHKLAEMEKRAADKLKGVEKKLIDEIS